jgi:hypothetical protein
MPRQRSGHSERSDGPIARKPAVVGVDDRVEDQTLDPIRKRTRVRDRELRPVGDPEQRQLLRAQLGPDRLHVGNRVRRRVVPPSDPEPVRAILAGARVAQVRVALQPRAPQQAGPPRPALVVADHPVAPLEVAEPGDDAQHLAHARPARAAGQVHHRRPGRAPDPRDPQRDGARVDAGTVQRNVQGRAADHPEVHARAPFELGRRGRREGEQHEQREGNGPPEHEARA